MEDNIKFRIQQIDTTQFAMLAKEIDENFLTTDSGIEFGINEENRLLRAMFKYQFLSNGAKALILETAVNFEIEDVCFEEKIRWEGSFKIPKVFATHLGMIAVGTSRGILHEKTNGTIFNNFPMPTIDLTETINEDIYFKLVESL